MTPSPGAARPPPKEGEGPGVRGFSKPLARICEEQYQVTHCLALLKKLGSSQERALGNNQRSAFHPVVDMDGIAPAGQTDRGDVDRCSAVATNHVSAILIIALRAANHARVQRCADRV